jgi:hypothetical protein
MQAEPQMEHQWLQKLVGEWTYEGSCPGEEGKAPVKYSGMESVRSLGGLWVVGEGRGEMPGGGTATMIITLGYDPAKKKYVGTWIGSMMTKLWVYEGRVEGNTLTLDTEGPNCMAEGKTARYQDIIEFKGSDARTLTSRVQGEDGAWTQIMQAEYRRRS